MKLINKQCWINSYLVIRLHESDWMSGWTAGAFATEQGRARCITAFLSPIIPCPSFCRWCGVKAWAGLLEMRGSRAFSGPLSFSGPPWWRWDCWSGSPTPRGLPPIKPGSTKYLWVLRWVPIRPWWIQAVTKPPSIKAWCSRGHWIRAARLRWGVCTETWRITP